MDTPRSVQRTYITLILGNTLAASLIWGINTIFLLDAGLSNLEAFAANAFFTAGMMLFEVPTGIVADTVGRRASYLLGTLTLAGSTLLYVAALAAGGAVLGLGDRLDADRARLHVLLRRGRGVARRRARRRPASTGDLDAVFARGQIASGAAMLDGVGGRRVHRRAGRSSACRSCSAAIVLLVMFVVAFRLMHDLGLHARPERPASRPRCAASPRTRSSTAGASRP